MSVLLDVLTVLIILATIWLSYRRGFLYTVIGLVGYVLAVFAAIALSVPLGSWIYTHLLQNIMLAHVKNYLAGHTLSSLTEQFGQSIQQFAPGLNLNSLFQQRTGQLENAAMQAVIQPIGMSIGRGIAFIILFFLFITAVHIFENLSLGISRVPVLGALNRIGGAVLGIVKAFLMLFVICTLISALLPILNVSNFPITTAVIDQTSVFKYFYQSNPFAKIL
ncbi:MAG: CvpA family protein [Ethanoligenens sp.]